MNLLAYFEPTAFVAVDIYYLVADIYDPVAACGYILSSGLPSIYVMLKF